MEARFHDRVRACKPDDQMKPNRYWVAVLHQGKSPDADLEQSDFLWIKANARITVRQIADAYLDNYHEYPQLMQDGGFPNLDVRMDDLSSIETNPGNPKIIVFQAVAQPNKSPALVNHVESSEMPMPVSSERSRPLESQLPRVRTNGQNGNSVKKEEVNPGSSTMPSPAVQPPASHYTAPRLPVERTLSIGLGGAGEIVHGKCSSVNGSRSSSSGTGGLNTPQTHQSHAPTTSSGGYASVYASQQTRPMVYGALPPSSLGGSYTTPAPGNYNNMPQSAHSTTPTLQYPSSKTPNPPPTAQALVKLKAEQTTTPPGSPPVSDRPLKPLAAHLPPLDDTLAADAFPTDEGISSQIGDHNDEIELRRQHVFLQQLLEKKKDDPELLESGMQAGLRLIEKMRDPLNKYANDSIDASEWLNALDAIKKQAVRTRTVVGVVGHTGAGKSSVINAILDEERLIPTNCMRACTAVVTEISYNDCEDENSKYRAEVEFIKHEEWRKELELCLADLLDGSGNVVKDATNAESEAGVAYAKIKAVYPHKTREMLKDATIEGLLHEVSVKNVLGTSKTIKERTPEQFYTRLQRWVDSKDRGKAIDKSDKKVQSTMEYWPLIKVVKIYTKSPALSTGAVIVDLPGVQDDNAARRSVAEGYMKQCTGLWIVAPITRAVDDKAAKNLLGDSFKRILKYDGTYSAVTFICSKTDDISMTEALETLQLTDTAQESLTELDNVTAEIKSLQEQLKGCRETKAAYSESKDRFDEQIEVWEGLKDKLDDGETVYEPSQSSKKRKRDSTKSKTKGKKRRGNDSDDDFIDDAEEVDSTEDESSSEEDEADDVGERVALTEDVVEAKLKELKQQKKDARQEERLLEEKFRDFNGQIKQSKKREFELESEINALCIQARNEYSKSAIQEDFALGIKELDQEAAMEQDEENFDPEEDIRDYEEVKRSLPVFCISSRAYQKLSGRLKRDKAVPGFSRIEETCIPQLQTHCKKLTEAGRAAACRRFLGDLGQIMNSMELWSSNDGTGVKMSEREKKAEIAFLEKELLKVGKGLDKIVGECLEDMTTVLTENVYEKYEEIIPKAAEAAVPTASGWGAHKDAGGLYWATYKATVRRNGIYKGASGPRDFNGELVEPIIKSLATGWERAFQRRLPIQIANFTRKTVNLLRSFNDVVQKRAQDTGASLAGLAALNRQLQGYEPHLNEHARAVVELMTATQRDASREFIPAIAQAMSYAYVVCTEERGKGSFMRMKQAMVDHVSRARNTMFHDACQGVKDNLNSMCQNVKLVMAERAEAIYHTLRRDYTMVLGGKQYSDASMLPKTEHEVRGEIADILEVADEDIFRPVVDPEGYAMDRGVQNEDQGQEAQDPDDQDHEAQSHNAEKHDTEDHDNQDHDAQDDDVEKRSDKQDDMDRMEGTTPVNDDVNGADDSASWLEDTMVEDDNGQVESSGKTAVLEDALPETLMQDVDS